MFISVSEEPSLDALLSYASAAGMLTVEADSERFLAHGGIIQLSVDTNRVRFQVDIKNADRAGLRISSKLLALAREATQ